MINLKDKIAIITGAQQGIGKGIAQKLAQLGAKVIVTDIDEENCQKVAKEINGEAFKMDVTNDKEIKKVVDSVVKKYGRIDILVNNAGICELEEFDDFSKVDKTINVDLKGVIQCAKAVLPHMLKKEYGKIVNISSIAALVSWPKLHTYSAAKGGVISFTKALAGEFGVLNINAVAPGAIETPMLDNVSEQLGTTREQTKQAIPKNRIGEPEDIANAVAFLVSDSAEYITGQVLVVDGGYTIR
jgi:NAD(P)-dependent dehydrogenase (short-subunit alcohol dehydrogenase family)